MVERVSDRPRLAVVAALGFILLAAGCQSGNPIGALGIGGGQEQAPDDRVSVQELLAYCPPLTIRASNAVFDSYQRGGDGDPTRLAYRASITEATRACTYGPGTLGMTIAVAGRVIPGPVAATGTVRAPIRVTVLRGTETIHDQVYDQQVALSDIAGATQFLFSESSLSIPTPASRNINVYVGFENQPAGRR